MQNQRTELALGLSCVCVSGLMNSYRLQSVLISAVSLDRDETVKILYSQLLHSCCRTYNAKFYHVDR